MVDDHLQNKNQRVYCIWMIREVMPVETNNTERYKFPDLLATKYMYWNNIIRNKLTCEF